MKQTRLLLSLLLLVTASLLSTGCTTDQAVMAQANNFDGQLKPATIQDPELAAYLQAVGDRIISTAKELDAQGFGPPSHKKADSQWMYGGNMKFHFVNSKTLNAFTTGGEHMYIYTALFEQCKTEDELAAVMAHEYGHVYARHVQKGMDRQMGLLGATTGAGIVGTLLGGEKYGQTYGAAAAGITGVAANFVGMGFTRKDESEADSLGFTFYTRGGWDPNHFGDFFQHMIDLGLDTGSEYLSDHPTLKSRVEKSKQMVAELPPQASSWKKPPVADDQKFAALKARAKDLGAKLPTDASLQAQKILAALPRSCLTPTIPQDMKNARAQLVQDSKRAEANAKKK